ncbi:MAG: hypothetical protein IT177_18430 [Acidobacteria bacterium]|nr:hypothetical protein [Acidobacteriota bacterium]
MARFHWRPRRIGVADAPPVAAPPLVDDSPFDVNDLAALHRAYYGPAVPPEEPATAVRSAKITLTRQHPNDFPDRQLQVFLNGEEWCRIRSGESITRELAPGPYQVKAFNTMFTKTLDVHLRPGEHVRLRCSNGFPTAGWFLMLFLHVTYLRVHLEREPSV